MPTSLSLEKLLLAARLTFYALGYLPLDVAADLAAHGCIVSELEDKWIAEWADVA